MNRSRQSQRDILANDSRDNKTDRILDSKENSRFSENEHDTKSEQELDSDFNCL